jgi:hypothetical protein
MEFLFVEVLAGRHCKKMYVIKLIKKGKKINY